MQKLDANVMQDGLPAQPQIANGIILDMSCFDFLESMQAERVETAVPSVHHLSGSLSPFWRRRKGTCSSTVQLRIYTCCGTRKSNGF